MKKKEHFHIKNIIRDYANIIVQFRTLLRAKSINSRFVGYTRLKQCVYVCIKYKRADYE